MKILPTWEMRVAVISTAHHPQGWKPTHRDYFFKTDDEADGVVVYIADLIKEDPVWLRTLAVPLLAGGFDWVRFDRDAEVVEGLPTFKWD